jgi:hypothetical protein
MNSSTAWTKIVVGSVVSVIGLLITICGVTELYDPVLKEKESIDRFLMLAKTDWLIGARVSTIDISSFGMQHQVNQLTSIYQYSQVDAELIVRYCKLIDRIIPHIDYINIDLDHTISVASEESIRELLPSPPKDAIIRSFSY